MAEEGGVPQPIAEEETRAISGAGEQSLADQRSRLQPTLKILTGLEAGRTHVLLGHETVVGRGAQCDLSIDDGALSRRHCRVFRSGDTFVTEDLGSRNGTRVDGVAISFAVPLREGAIIHLAAGAAIKFSWQDEIEVQAQHRLYESAVLDALTGVHNRRDMDQRLRAELAFASRHQSPLSALLLDIDHSPEHFLAAGNKSLYTSEGLASIRNQLKLNGCFALWSNDPGNEVFTAHLRSAFGTATSHNIEFPNPYTNSVSINSVYVAREIGDESEGRITKEEFYNPVA